MFLCLPHCVDIEVMDERSDSSLAVLIGVDPTWCRDHAVRTTLWEVLSGWECQGGVMATVLL